MSVIKTFKPQVSEFVFESSVQTVVASLVGVSEEGRPLIVIGDSPETEARSALSKEDCAEIQCFPVSVLVAIEANSSEAPIITGLVRERLFPIGEKAAKKAGNYKAVVDGQTVTLSANEEIKLECGKSSILLKKDGKIVIKGVNLVSRSLATNKIKGSSVSIN